MKQGLGSQDLSTTGESKSPLLLDANRVSKRYSGIVALDAVSLDLLRGEVLAIVGENGAGKSTLIKILDGAIQPDSGDIFLDGKRYAPADPSQARLEGIAVIHQDLQLIPQLPISANIFLHNIPVKKPFSSFGLLDREELARRTTLLLHRLGVDIAPQTLVRDLSAAAKQLVQIAKAFSFNSRILIMDEPTASLEANEVEKLFAIVRQIRAQGTSVIFVSHRLDEVMEIADRITVFRDGRVVAKANKTDLSPNELIRLIVGRELKTIFPKELVTIGTDVLRVDRLRSGEVRQETSVSLREREILGITGLVGSGSSELLKAVCGQNPPAHGRIVVNGKSVEVKGPADSIRSGIGYVPEDRKSEGLLQQLSIEDNIILPNLRKVTRWGFVSRGKVRQMVLPLIRALNIKAASSKTRVINLSGGNQQKVVIAKWLASDARILVLNEPTHGVDIGAKAEVHKLMGQFVRSGGSILFASSELPEVLAISDRIAVFHKGGIAGELDAASASSEKVLSLAAGYGHVPANIESGQ